MEMAMASMTATDAKNRFGEVLELARKEPVRVQKNGRDVAVVLSAEEYQSLIARGQERRIDPLVVKLHNESVKRWGKVYKALAK
jgi:prevent-host-death family protein